MLLSALVAFILCLAAAAVMSAGADFHTGKVYGVCNGNPHDNEKVTVFFQKALSDPVAVFTMLLAVFTFPLSVVAVIQMHYIVRSDTNTVAALGAANRQAQASEEALKQSREAVVISQRPWLSIKLAPGRLSLFNHDIRYLEMTAIVQNHGNSPAIRVRAEFGYFSYTESHLACYERLRLALSSGRHEDFKSWAVFPGIEQTIQGQIHFPEEPKGVTAPSHLVGYVACVVSYEFAMGGRGFTTASAMFGQNNISSRYLIVDVGWGVPNAMGTEIPASAMVLGSTQSDAT